MTRSNDVINTMLALWAAKFCNMFTFLCVHGQAMKLKFMVMFKSSSWTRPASICSWSWPSLPGSAMSTFMTMVMARASSAENGHGHGHVHGQVIKFWPCSELYVRPSQDGLETNFKNRFCNFFETVSENLSLKTVLRHYLSSKSGNVENPFFAIPYLCNK